MGQQANPRRIQSWQGETGRSSNEAGDPYCRSRQTATVREVLMKIEVRKVEDIRTTCGGEGPCT